MSRAAYLARETDVLGEDRQRFLDSARSSTFLPATVIGDASWRRAFTCPTWSLLEEAKTEIAYVLNIDPAEVIDIQLTRTEEGGYFKPHYDNNYPETAHRRVTFVYYLGDRETFRGGTLNFPELGVRVDPDDDSLVFFPSGELHEITRVMQKPGEAPAARYTLNGWLR